MGKSAYAHPNVGGVERSSGQPDWEVDNACFCGNPASGPGAARVFLAGNNMTLVALKKSFFVLQLFHNKAIYSAKFEV